MKHPILLFLFVFVMVGCVSVPTFDTTFSMNQQVQGSVAKIPYSMEITWDAALEVFSRQGFVVKRTDPQSGIILAAREMQDPNDNDYSHTMTVNLMLVPLSDRMTQVLVAANETTEFHEKEYRWWKLLGLIPLLPIGPEYTAMVVHQGTVRSPKFFLAFFDALELSCDEKNQQRQSVLGSSRK